MSFDNRSVLSRELDVLSKRKAALKKKAARVEEELEGLLALDSLNAGQADRFDDLTRAGDKIGDEAAKVAAKREALFMDGIADGTFKSITGDGARGVNEAMGTFDRDPVRDPGDVYRPRNQNPWAGIPLSGMPAWQNGSRRNALEGFRRYRFEFGLHRRSAGPAD